MIYSQLFCAAVFSASILSGVSANPANTLTRRRGGRGNNNDDGNDSSVLSLDPNNVATGSQSDGQDSTAKAGTAASIT